jgi:hypothetical protein
MNLSKMNLRKSILLVLSLGMIAALVACSSSSSGGSGGGGSSNTPAAISANSGYTASAVVAASYGTLAVTVTNSSGTGVSGASVTFTAPATGASGTFASNSTATETDTTNSSGVATSSAFTANDTAGAYQVSAAVSGVSTPATFSLSNTSAAAATVAVNGGNSQTVAPGANFSALSVIVEDQFQNPVSGASVTFTVVPGTSSASFGASGTTDTETTGANGIATTSQTLTANATAGSFTVTASSGSLTPASFSETISSTSIVAAGNYVYRLEGVDTDDNSQYFVSGVITVSSTGAITGGEQDYIDDNGSGTQDNESDQINPTGSSIATTSDGNIQLILTTCDGTNCAATDGVVGVAGVETFNAAFTPNNPNKAYIIDYDTSGAASGTLILQNATDAAATPSLGYAFVLSGYDGFASPSTGGFPMALGGVVNIDGSGTMDGTGSIFDANDSGDPNDGGTGLPGIFPGETFGAGTVSAPDAFGRVVFSLNPSDTTNFPGPINLVGYIIDTRITLVETADGYQGTLGGIAYSQGANTGTFSTSSSSISGATYVAGLHGFDANGPFQVGGVISLATGGAGVSAEADFNDLVLTEPTTPDAFTATAYTVDAAGAGDVTISGLADSASNTFNVQLYVDGNGNAVGITLDTTDVLSGSGGVQSAVDTDANFTGNYAMTTTGWDAGMAGLYSTVGPVAATGTTDTLGGTADINWNSGPTLTQGEAFTGTYTAFVGGGGILSPNTILGLDLASGFTNTDAFDFYLIDAQGDGLLIETDTNQLTIGVFDQQ